MIQTLKPSSGYRPLKGNRQNLASFEAVFLWFRKGYFIPLGFCLVWMMGLSRCALGKKRSEYVWVMSHVLFIVLVGALLSGGENERFRFLTDALTVAMAAAMLSSVIRRFSLKTSKV